MKKILLFLFTFLSVLSSNSINQYINQKSCVQIINKKLYHICYSYKYKGAIAGWVELDGELVAKNKIRKRARFYSKQQIPLPYRSHYKDYTGVADQWNREHFIVADADFDYDHKALKQAYSRQILSHNLPHSIKKLGLKWKNTEENLHKNMGISLQSLLQNTPKILKQSKIILLSLVSSIESISTKKQSLRNALNMIMS